MSSSGQHPERRLLELFMAGDLPAEESKGIVMHLLSGCESCRRIARESFPCSPKGSSRASDLPEQWQSHRPDTYASVFENVIPKVWAAEAEIETQRNEAPGLLAELERHPHERRLLLVRNSPRFNNWRLCELVIERAHGEGVVDPPSAVDFGVLATELAYRLEGDAPRLLLDLRCRAHSILGNALRISGSLDKATEQFQKAEKCLASGTGDVLERARFMELRSSLLSELRRFSEAMALLDSAIGIYRSSYQRHRLGRALILKGHHLGEKGDLAGAVSSLQQGLRYIDQDVEPRLVLVAKHNLTRNLYQAGRYHQALAMLPETRSLHEELGNELDLVRFDWLKALILRDSGDFQGAEAILNRVKAAFVDKGIAHDSALVSLDLAVIYLRQQRAAELKATALEMLTIFKALRVNRELIAALVLFQKAVEVERVTLGLVRDLSAYLKTSRHEAHLPFRPSRAS